MKVSELMKLQFYDSNCLDIPPLLNKKEVKRLKVTEVWTLGGIIGLKPEELARVIDKRVYGA